MGKKATTITLSTDDRSYLEKQTRARTIQAQTVNRARILLLKADGISIDDIADKVGMNRKSVMLCIKKYLEGGVENALNQVTDEAEIYALSYKNDYIEERDNLEDYKRVSVEIKQFDCKEQEVESTN